MCLCSSQECASGYRRKPEIQIILHLKVYIQVSLMSTRVVKYMTLSNNPTILTTASLGFLVTYITFAFFCNTFTFNVIHVENYIISETIDVYLFRQMYLLWQHINGEVGLDHPRTGQLAHLGARLTS